MTYRHIGILEREQIQFLLWKKWSIRAIATKLGRSHSSIVRELKRVSGGRSYQYRPRLAQARALAKRKCRGRKNRLKTEKIRQYVIDHLHLRWSPEQISGRIKLDIQENISPEAIYQYIYYSERNGIVDGEDLRQYLRRRRKRRIPHGARRGQRIFCLHGPSIVTRPVVVNQRRRVGDWEGDSVESVNHRPGVNTLVERKTGLTFITKLRNRNSAETIRVMSERFAKIPTNLKQTITLDNGPENRDWSGVEKYTGLKCYYARPYCSGDRGTNENTNGLIRDYFPKKTDFSMISDEVIQLVEYQLNGRPRKRLNWLTPLEAWSGAI